MSRPNQSPFKQIPQATHDNNKGNFPSGSKPKFKRSGKDKYIYQNRFKPYRPPFGYQVGPQWNFFRWRKPWFRVRQNPPPEAEPPRPTSPFTGTEEHTLKKIQETSDMIKKRLLMPEPVAEPARAPTPPPVDRSAETATEKRGERCENGRSAPKSRKPAQYNVEEIHQKIITHITNLNHGKKMNLICATSSGYDEAIRQIQKQKRLELSKVLRDMCSKQTVGNRDVISAIMPDIGIKLEDLPLEVIQELSSTLDLNFNNASSEEGNGTVRIKSEICDIDEFVSSYPILNGVKEENDCDDTGNSDCPMDSIDSTTPDIHVSSEYGAEREPQNNETVSYNSESTQTDIICNSIATQTDLEINTRFQVKNKAETLEDAIKSMLEIDKEIARLTKLRQSVFLKLQKRKSKNAMKKKVQAQIVEPEAPITISESEESNESCYEKPLNFSISEKILVLQAVNDALLAGCESGVVYFLSLKDGSILRTIDNGGFTISSLCVWFSKKQNLHLFVGSFGTYLKEYQFESGHNVRTLQLRAGAQCMEQSWGYIFIGTLDGDLIRYNLVKAKIEFEDRISRDRILVLKAAQEGARRILLVATKNLAVCVRDAMSGLHMRTMNHIVAPTVYSLLLENSLVYCGTPFHDILVFSFHDGNLIRKYQASNAKGIGCMKIVDNLLYAGCHNGNIYVYNILTKSYVGCIEGPGGVVLSLEIFKNIIIVGTMSFNFKSLLIPKHFLENNR